MSKKITIGYIPVDSGQIMIIDPCYLNTWKDGDFVPENLNKPPKNDYDAICRMAIKAKPYGEYKKDINGAKTQAVVLGTGDDGYYKVIGIFNKASKTPKEIRIIFN